MTNIGFDLDKVFINYPPFIPGWIIDKLYKKKANGTLLYRIPGTFEQKLRIISHHPLLRSGITSNLTILEKIAKANNAKLFLISSRFSFLRNRTNDVIKRYNFDNIFTNMYFNYQDEQPHLFKNAIIMKKKINKYVDDDLPLLRYLSSKNPTTLFFWLNSFETKKIGKNLFAITDLSQILK